MVIRCNRCNGETVGLDPFTRVCPNGLDEKHGFTTNDGIFVPDYIKCEECGQIYPASQAIHFHREFGWSNVSKILVYLNPDLYDVKRHLCLDCGPDDLKKWDFIRKQIMGRGK